MLVETHTLREDYHVEIHAVGEGVNPVFRAVLYRGSTPIDTSRSYEHLTQAREELGFYAAHVRSLG